MLMQCHGIFNSTRDSFMSLHRRALALGLLCALGGAELARQAHEALVRHVRCEVHGDQRHEDGPADAPHTDEHGDLAVLGSAPPPAAPALTIFALPHLAVASPASAPARRAQLKLWAMAPKASPPAR